MRSIIFAPALAVSGAQPTDAHKQVSPSNARHSFARSSAAPGPSARCERFDGAANSRAQYQQQHRDNYAQKYSTAMNR
jgi:hypothetical protein